MTRPVLTYPKEWCAEVETEFRLRSNSLFSAGMSPGAPDIYGPNAQVWTASIPIAPTRRRDWMRIEAFFSRAGGIAGRIRMFDPKRIRPGRDIPPEGERTTTGNPWSDDTYFDDGTGWDDNILPPYCSLYEPASGLADSFVLSGLPASMAPCLWAGDLIEIRPNGVPADFGHLYEVAFDAPTNSDGLTRVSINPGLRSGIAGGDMAVLRYPMSIFRLIDDDQGRLAFGHGGIARSGFSLLELLP